MFRVAGPSWRFLDSHYTDCWKRNWTAEVIIHHHYWEWGWSNGKWYKYFYFRYSTRKIIVIWMLYSCTLSTFWEVTTTSAQCCLLCSRMAVSLTASSLPVTLYIINIKMQSADREDIIVTLTFTFPCSWLRLDRQWLISCWQRKKVTPLLLVNTAIFISNAIVTPTGKWRTE